VRSDEVVHDAVSFGGDTIVDGEVRGDAVSFGGAVRMNGGRVQGDVVNFGTAPSVGCVTRHARGPIDGIGRWLADAARGAMAHVLLFLLGLVLIGVTRERLGAMQVTMIRDGLKTAGTGLLGYVASVVAIILLVITVIGIPAAVVLALALPVATYIGLAAAATVIGAALPIPQLKGNEVAQLAAGVAVLFVASLVPVAGTIATMVAACLGFGALIRTRFEKAPPADVPNGEGPFRTPASVT
jgi:hypothetical protein